MSPHGDEDRGRDDHPEERRRQFEESRGLTDRPELPLEEDEPETPPEDEDEARRKEKKEAGGGKDGE